MGGNTQPPAGRANALISHKLRGHYVKRQLRRQKTCSKLITKTLVIVLNVVKVKINQFQVNVPFLHPLKTSEKRSFSRTKIEHWFEMG